MLYYQIVKKRERTNMEKRLKDKYQLHAQILKALSHPTRLFIVNELENGERCVCELQAMIEDDVSTISKHLSILKQAGIIEDRKEGLNVYYHLKLTCIPTFLFCIENMMMEKTKQQYKILKESVKTK